MTEAQGDQQQGRIGPALLKISDLRVGYGRKRILPPIQMEVHRGEMWGLIGHNGSGKSTLLKTLLKIIPKISGEITTAPKLKLGYIPQLNQINEDTPARVLDVVAAGTLRGWSFLNPLQQLFKRKKIFAALKAVGISELAWRQLSQLSVGQKQRVFQARLIAGQPDLMILDEPTSAMDPKAERETFDRLKEWSQSRALIVVSHHLGILIEYATHLLLLDQDEDVVVAGETSEVIASDYFRRRHGQHAQNQHPQGQKISPLNKKPQKEETS